MRQTNRNLHNIKRELAQNKSYSFYYFLLGIWSTIFFNTIFHLKNIPLVVKDL